MDPDDAKARMRAMWGLGDYSRIAERFSPIADELVGAAGVGPGQRVLDVAAGTGNVALAAARSGAVVTASDLTPEMIALGRARARDEGHHFDWVEADVEDLPFGSADFDAALSCFGVMFAPRPEVAVAELARVLRPGGRLAMASWSPDGPMNRVTEAVARRMPRTPDAADPRDWGREDVARQRLAAAFTELQCRLAVFVWRFDSAGDARRFFETCSPPHVAVAAAIGPQAAAEMFDEIEAIVGERADEAGAVALPSDYLVVLARRPAA
ncbi:class I SAM-dependent methyltransferase [soil metagenome]